ncbi:mannose-P-dolichol utilization defect 1 protein homolog [Toxorhynchites rutilus septentrionalis]|uniref:mannose-P-dolichol utilization defect 1 protein homolog n=1 Tax=Toxorhynchites rutilus septentrionalis TaxID=329112 RepID=UPI002479EE4E|nr:mannose-P-dolichol utilization defect 1 protein homolog [Toxorhynchites rutilus septentrionalis]
MTEYVKQFLMLFMNEKCYDNYFVDFDFLDVDCFKALLSKGLGIAIIAGSVLVKVPQISKILANKSAQGINLFSVCLDLFAITIHMSYSFVNGFPFSAWGDTSFLALQTALIAFLVLWYGGAKAQAFIFSVIFTATTYALMGGLTPLKYLLIAQGFNVPIILLGKLSQAYTNYKNGSTGQLSAVTCFMVLAGSLARIFTSIQETGDQMMVITYGCSSFANAVIVLQLLYYWNADKKTSNDGGASKKASKAKAKKIN